VDPGHRDDEHAVLDAEILAAAAALGALGAEVHVAHCLVSTQDILAAAAAGAVPPYADIGADEATRGVGVKRRERIEALARRSGLETFRLHLLEGRAVDELPALAEKTHADVLILGGVSRSRLAQVFVGGTAERLLDRARCDLLVMRPPGAAAETGGG
jgi:universal stress protein E